MNRLKAFEVLGIPVIASKAEIKQARNDLLIIWHPDKHHENERRRKLAEEKAKEINEAYEIAYKYDCRRDQQQSCYKKEQKKQTTNTEADKPSWIVDVIVFATIGVIIKAIVLAIRQLTG